MGTKNKWKQDTWGVCFNTGFFCFLWTAFVPFITATSWANSTLQCCQCQGLEFDTKKNACKTPAGEHYYCFSYGPMNPDVCNCRTVLVIPSLWKHCSVCLKQYCEVILQSSNLSSFSWAVWNNEEQWTIVLVVQARPRAEVVQDLS